MQSVNAYDSKAWEHVLHLCGILMWFGRQNLWLNVTIAISSTEFRAFLCGYNCSSMLIMRHALLLLLLLLLLLWALQPILTMKLNGGEINDKMIGW